LVQRSVDTVRTFDGKRKRAKSTSLNNKKKRLQKVLREKRTTSLYLKGVRRKEPQCIGQSLNRVAPSRSRGVEEGRRSIMAIDNFKGTNRSVGGRVAGEKEKNIIARFFRLLGTVPGGVGT